MINIEPTTTITVDETTYTVEKMSAEVQQLVNYFDHCREKEATAAADLMVARHALRDIQNTLLATINKEREEALKKAEALGIITQPTQTSVAPSGDAVAAAEQKE